MLTPRRISTDKIRRYKGGIVVSAGLAALLALPALGLRPGQTPRTGKSAYAQSGSSWVPISDYLLKKLTEEGKKISFPGGTAGVSVDRKTGDVSVVVPGQGLWRSRNKGKTFERIDGGIIGGSCETGYSINADPAGSRLACFLLDGQSGMTLDDGKTWSTLAQIGRGWDFGVVDWSRSSPQDMLAVHHESGRELYSSADGGKSWKLLGKGFTAVGIYGPHTYVASKGDGILLSVNGGLTWIKVSNITPTGRTLCIFNGIGYWIAPEGLLLSLDRGVTWHYAGSPIESAWGPYFGVDETQIAIVGRKGNSLGIWRTDDSTKTWKFAAPFPNYASNTHPSLAPSQDGGAGWGYNFGWDWKSRVFYASHMSNPTLAIPSR